MSKLKAQIMDMVEFATLVSKAEFVNEYGAANADFYDQVHGIRREIDPDPTPAPEAVIDENGVPF